MKAFVGIFTVAFLLSLLALTGAHESAQNTEKRDQQLKRGQCRTVDNKVGQCKKVTDCEKVKLVNGTVHQGACPKNSLCCLKKPAAKKPAKKPAPKGNHSKKDTKKNKKKPKPVHHPAKKAQKTKKTKAPTPCTAPNSVQGKCLSKCSAAQRQVNTVHKGTKRCAKHHVCCVPRSSKKPVNPSPPKPPANPPPPNPPPPPLPPAGPTPAQIAQKQAAYIAAVVAAQAAEKAQEAAELQALAQAVAANTALEATAHAIAAAMGGQIQVVGNGDYECYCGADCGETGSCYHWGITMVATMEQVCGNAYPAMTTCVSGGLEQTNSQRGYVMVHESCHLYMWRMQNAGHLTGWYNQVSFSGGAWLAYPGVESFTDCLAQTQGAPLMNPDNGYGCPSFMATYAQQLVAQFPPTSSAWLKK